MSVELFAAARVADFAAAVPWYERLFGGPPSFAAHETEVVWQIAEHAWVAVHEDENAGGAEITILVEDLDAHVAELASRDLEPAEWETYSNGVRKAIFRDADGNEFGFGGVPKEQDGG